MSQEDTTPLDETSTSVIVWPNDGKEMVLIGGGDCLIGANEGHPNQQPQHRIYVAEFYIDRWPVTNAEYREFIEDAGHPIPNYQVSWCDTEAYNWDRLTRMYPAGKADHPVVLVTWEDAMAYAAWAGKRLPTEAEWERAGRGLAGYLYPWGNEPQPGRCNSKEAGLGTTSPIGLFSPEGDSPEGLVDMVGNVWEWTNSLFRPYPYNADDGRENRQAAGFRVLRGGSWINDACVANCLSRLDGDFQFFTNVGFRCAVSPD